MTNAMGLYCVIAVVVTARTFTPHCLQFLAIQAIRNKILRNEFHLLNYLFPKTSTKSIALQTTLISVEFIEDYIAPNFLPIGNVQQKWRLNRASVFCNCFCERYTPNNWALPIMTGFNLSLHCPGFH